MLLSRPGHCLAIAGDRLCEAPCVLFSHDHDRQGQHYEHHGAGYCDEHGGEQLAAEKAERIRASCWHTLAPPELSAHQVNIAGAWHLWTRHVYLVLRPTAEQAERWKVGLGIWADYEDRPGSWATQLQAESAGIRYWRLGLDAEVERIRKGRGGTLDWGDPVEPRSEPLVLIASAAGYIPDTETARPPLAEALSGPVTVGLTLKEARAVDRLRTGARIVPADRKRIRGLLERARMLDVPFPDEGALLAELSRQDAAMDKARAR